MKKILESANLFCISMDKILLILLMALSLHGKAQTDEGLARKFKPKKASYRIGLFIGPGISFPYDASHFGDYYRRVASNINGNYYLNSKIGGAIGLSLIRPFGKNWTIGSRVAYDKRGYLTTIEFQGNVGGVEGLYKYSTRFNDNYLTTLVLTQFLFGQSKNYSLSAGVYFSHLIKSVGKEFTYLNNSIINKSLITNSSTKKCDYGIQFGIGRHFKIKKINRFFVDIQGIYGLTSIVNVNSIKIQNSNVYLFTSYKIGQSLNSI